MSAIGSRIVELRQRDSLSQERLADLLSTGRSTVIRYETGKTYPNSEVIIRLCGIFSVSADYLLGMTDECATPISDDASLCSRQTQLPSSREARQRAADTPALSSFEEIKRYIDEEIAAALARHGII